MLYGSLALRDNLTGLAMIRIQMSNSGKVKYVAWITIFESMKESMSAAVTTTAKKSCIECIVNTQHST